MPKYKDQHFVPQFYLRRFSEDGKSIRLCHLPSNRVIPRAPLKTQCSRRYFYGRDPKVEQAISLAEGAFAALLREIDSCGRPPAQASGGHFTLIMMILMQLGRTEYAAELATEITDSLAKHLLASSAEMEGIDLSGVVIGPQYPATYASVLAMSCYPVMLDLELALLVNESREQFITSDNPVVRYNQLMSFRRFISNTGVASKGLEVFFPIDSRHIVLLYDGEAYGVRRRNGAVVPVTDERDVHGLNVLQVCSALNTVYFRDAGIDLDALRRKAAPFMRTEKQHFGVLSRREYRGGAHELVGTSIADVNTQLDLSFLRITRRAREWRAEFRRKRLQPAVVLRNEGLTRDCEEFRDRVRKGEYDIAEFGRFLEERRREDSSAG